MTDIRRRWQQSEDGAAKAAPFSLQVTAYSSKRVAAHSAVFTACSVLELRADSIAASKKLSCESMP
ncbi:hypothetical protein Rleg5DRAFT_3969 [Rhizobium leguminosarum bv. viciae WSM1455]|nr:hypothetical protein Rleg5DRAFT_3969 [Rhizobium leguminosarum bv. viciae WSM1455]